MCVHVHICVCMWKPEVDVFLDHSELWVATLGFYRGLFSYSEGTLPTKQLSPLPLILRFLFVCFFSERVLTCTPG